KHTDAALLQLVQVGFLPPDDDRVTGTIAAIRRELEVAPGLLHRYLSERTDDGVAGSEHAFLACSFWLADALSRRDELDEATAVLDILTGLTNEVGLLAEQYDPCTGQMAGNFPQALSHLALVRAVHSHDEAVARRDHAQHRLLGRSQ
ncbi:MAG TPA: glycoside hydrolase family 15 protein, partial [Cellulomonas sp.]|nr:glycoside hydrolase family 15 protein [Cellulomonas sp.]